MPDYLVERITASLAAAASQRPALSANPATPMLASTRHRRRVLLGIAGMAAAFGLVAVVGDSLISSTQPARSTGVAAAGVASPALSPGGLVRGGAGPQGVREGAASSAQTTAPVLRIRLSGTRYTEAGFTAQALTLRTVIHSDAQPSTNAKSSPGVVPLGTGAGLSDCVRAIGAGQAQLVQADYALYDGAPAVVIVATTNGRATAYAVGRACSPTHPDILRPATALP
jgi:hypothetical protein